MTKEELRQISPEEMAARGLLTPAKKGGYVCECGNGNGEDGTGVDWTLLDGGWVGKCFKCGEGWDIFKLIKVKFNLPDFKNQLNKANEIFDPGACKPNDYRNYILACHKNLKKFVGDSYRGISFDTYKKFLCGYDYSNERFIIPTTFKHYLERYTGDKDIKSAKKHTGTKEIFAFKFAVEHDIIFIVEGEFDALSFWDVGYPAISFSGSDISKSQQAAFRKFPTDKKFIVAFDDDETGHLKSLKVADIIHSFGYHVGTAFLQNHNDANDFLRDDREKFIENIKGILANIKFIEPPVKTFGDLIIPDDFYMDKERIMFIDDVDRITFSDVPVTVKRLFHSENYDDFKFEFSIFSRLTERWHDYKINRADIADHKKLLPILASVNVNINNDTSKIWSKFLGDLATMNLKNIEEVVTFKYPGWHNEKFIYPADNVDNGTDYAKMFCTRGDKNIWLETVKKVFLKVPFAITLGTVLAAPIIKICGERHIQLALIAPSMRGKSAVIKLAMSVYGNPNELKNTFNSTANAINDLGWRFNDLPCWIDEFQAANKNIKEQIDILIYNYENGRSRLRLSKVGDQRDTFEFTGARIFSAEQSLLKQSTGQGAYTRLIELQYNEVCDKQTAFEIHKVAPFNYGFFGKAWIDYVESHQEEICATYREYLDNIETRFPKHAHAYIQAYSLIMTALEHFHNHFLNFYPAEDMKDLSEYISDVLFANLPTAEDSTNAKRALKDLSEALVTHARFFLKPYKEYSELIEKTPDNPQYVGESNQPYLGVFLKDGNFGFFPRAIKTFLEKECGYPDATAIFKALDEMGAIERGTQKDNPLVKNVFIRKWARLYVIKKEFLNDK